jgi:uncharacterized lipoprotein YajG
LKKYILILFLCCLLLPWAAQAKDQTINLKFMPREKVKIIPKNISIEKIYFQEIKDNRSRPQAIGENTEDKKKPVTILTSKADDTGQFVLSVLKKEFQTKGFKVENNLEAATKIITVTLVKFWTQETNRYNTEIQLQVEVQDKKNLPFFKKTYSSTGTNSGRSLSETNYNESFSDALSRMTDNLFSDLAFLQGLAEKPKPSIQDERRVEEKRLEDLKAQIKKLEELRAEEIRAKEKQEADRLSEERRLEEKRLKEKLDAERRAEEKRMGEIKAEIQRLEKLKADEKRALEEDKKVEEKRLEDLKAEVKRLEELKALKEEILAEEKRKEEERKAKEKKPASPKPKPAEPVFGPK